MTHAFLLNGREIKLEALSPQLDATFEKLHAAYYGNTPMSWDELAAAASQFFDDNIGNWGAHDAYFNNFTVIWRDLLANDRHTTAERLWSQALQPAWQWEQTRSQRLHKGTPYYFWAMTSLLHGDIDRGYLLSHQALQEDVDSSGQQTPDTPGYALISLNYTKDNQAFRQWVTDQAAYLNGFLTDYNNTHHRTLKLEDVKRRFLDQPPSTETVFLFTYTLARFMNIARLPKTATTNQFAGQLEINLLFDLTLVIEEAIKEKNPAKRQANNKKLTFVHQGDYLLTSAGHPLHIVDEAGDPVAGPALRCTNKLFDDDFDAALLAALDGTLAVPPNAALNRLQSDVELAYGIRNHASHNADSSPVIWNRFGEVQQALFRVFFAAIEHLY